MPEPTPGQVCYEAFWHALPAEYPPHPWAALPLQEQALWEAAAQAVLMAYKAEMAAGWQQSQTPRTEAPHA